VAALGTVTISAAMLGVLSGIAAISATMVGFEHLAQEHRLAIGGGLRRDQRVLGEAACLSLLRDKPFVRRPLGSDQWHHNGQPPNSPHACPVY